MLSPTPKSFMPMHPWPWKQLLLEPYRAKCRWEGQPEVYIHATLPSAEKVRKHCYAKGWGNTPCPSPCLSSPLNSTSRKSGLDELDSPLTIKLTWSSIAEAKVQLLMKSGQTTDGGVDMVKYHSNWPIFIPKFWTIKRKVTDISVQKC